MKALVTGGAGFIGAHLVRRLAAEPRSEVEGVVVVDRLTYAGSRERIAGLGDARVRLIELDIVDAAALSGLFQAEEVGAVFHLAAESHVDRSIAGPGDFVRTNVLGTYSVLEAARRRWESLSGAARDVFRLVHVSTDEVFGTLEREEAPFRPDSPACPNNPYAATKAGADMLARAWERTYGLPVATVHPCNVYGPWQHPEKLIPRMILRALEGGRLPLYGRGDQRREWLYVEDACEGVLAAWRRGRPGERYLLGGTGDRANLDVAEAVLERVRRVPGRGKEASVEFVEDRPGHDARYALDAAGAREALDWNAATDWGEGLDRTVQWYVEHEQWAREMEWRAGRWGIGRLRR